MLRATKTETSAQFQPTGSGEIPPAPFDYDFLNRPESSHDDLSKKVAFCSPERMRRHHSSVLTAQLSDGGGNLCGDRGAIEPIASDAES
jgi:hypothetical protein